MTNMQSTTILLVEDDQPILDGIVELLEIHLPAHGYAPQFLTAYNGHEALKQMAQQLPDLIISDIMMPGMDGISLLKEIRKHQAWVQIPIILATARGEASDILLGKISGAQLYVTKPFETKELIKLVAAQLDRIFHLRRSQAHNLANRKQSVLRMIGHELRTPLTYILAYHEIWSGSLSQASDDNRESIQGIQKGCSRLGNLIDDFIAVMELRSGETKRRYLDNRRQLHDVPQMLYEACEQLMPRIKQKNIELSVSIPEQLPPIYGHREALVNVFTRLIDNSIKFLHYSLFFEPTRKLGLTIEAMVENEQILLRFTDNGFGFPPNVSEQIFEFMYQYDRDVHEQQGSGSGLTIARGVLEMHGGSISAVGALHEGATFSVTLPITDKVTALSPQNGGHQPLKATIMIVEDDAHLLIGLKDLIEVANGRYEFTIITATNGVEALQQLTEKLPDLIISDIRMPAMGGYELLENVRANPAWVHIPFIFLTALGDRTEMIQGFTKGIQDYLIKPYKSEELLNLVHAYLDRHFQVQEAVGQSFEEIKYGILEILNPSFQDTRSIVSTHSDTLNDFIFDPAVNADMTIAETKDEEELTNLLFSISENNRLIERSVSDFIALAEFQTGEAEIAFQLEAEVLHETGYEFFIIADRFTLEIEMEEITLNKQQEGSVPDIYGDFKKLLDCQQHLLTSALHLCKIGSGDSITIGYEYDERWVQFHIEANGDGFNAEESAFVESLLKDGSLDILQLRLFGSHLALAQRILQLHQGKLTFESNESQHRFTMHLPVYTPTTR